MLPPSMAALLAAAPSLGGLALMIAAAGAWLLPMDSSMLEFSDAEQQFLFPAPVSRRQLLVYRMLRSQIGMLFGAAMIGIFSPPTLGVSRLRISVASWIILITARIYFTGVTLARARLGASGGRTRRVAWLPISALALALALVAGAIGAQWRQAPPADALAGLVLIGRAADTPAARLVLLPFRALVQPLFAEWPRPVPRGNRVGTGRPRRRGHLGAAQRRSVPGSGERRRGASKPGARQEGRTDLQSAIDRLDAAADGPAGDGVRVEGRDADAAHGGQAQPRCAASSFSSV